MKYWFKIVGADNEYIVKLLMVINKHISTELFPTFACEELPRPPFDARIYATYTKQNHICLFYVEASTLSF